MKGFLMAAGIFIGFCVFAAALGYFDPDEESSTAIASVSSSPFMIRFEQSQDGGDLVVTNRSLITYRSCKIEFGESEDWDRWYLAEDIVIDGSERLSYPTADFRDRRGKTPPSPDDVRKVFIYCHNPSVMQAFGH